jgi:hypothetical protein
MQSFNSNQTSGDCPSEQRPFFMRFGGAVGHDGGFRFGAIGRLAEDNHRGADEAPLKRETGGEDVAYLRGGLRFGLGFGQMMQLRIESIVDGGHQRNQPHPSRGIAAGILKEIHLLHQGGLRGPFRGAIQGVSVVEQPDDDLQPFVFRATQFLGFEPKGGSFTVIGFLQKLAECPGFGGHFGGDFPGGGDGVGGVFLHNLPARGCGVDLRGDHFKVVNFRNGGNQAAALHQSGRGAVFEHEGNDREHRAGDAAQHHEQHLPGAQRQLAVLRADVAGQRQEDGVTEEKRPFGQLKFSLIAHTKHS